MSQFDWLQNIGYAQSKCIAENLCIAAAQKAGVKARVLRVGQIVANTVHGVWNKIEATPLMIQSALTIGALPRLQESPSWTPVDVISKAVAEISLSNAETIVANITNAKTFSWNNVLLPTLRETVLVFEDAEPKEWVYSLRNFSDDVIADPTFKLVDFFASKYDRDTFGPTRTYQTTQARKYSPTLDNAPGFDASSSRLSSISSDPARGSSLPQSLQSKESRSSSLLALVAVGSPQ